MRAALLLVLALAGCWGEIVVGSRRGADAGSDTDTNDGGEG